MNGEKITISMGVLNIPDFPVIPFVEGSNIWVADFVRQTEGATLLKCSEFGDENISNM